MSMKMRDGKKEKKEKMSTMFGACGMYVFID